MAVSGRSAPVAMLAGELVAAAAAPPAPLGGITVTVRSFPMLQLLSFSRAAIVYPLPWTASSIGLLPCPLPAIPWAAIALAIVALSGLFLRLIALAIPLCQVRPQPIDQGLLHSCCWEAV